MINFDNAGPTFMEAFRLDDENINKVHWFLRFAEGCSSISRSIERVWIDETIDDNTRAFAIFAIGRMYEYKKRQKSNGKEGC